MGSFKNIVTIGIYYLKKGSHDFPSWSDSMVNHFGESIKPFLFDILKWSISFAYKEDFIKLKKVNCWEFHNCGFQKRIHVENDIYNTCPAVTETRLDGIHNGKNGGRACWVIAGTKCGGWIQKTYAQKFISCSSCAFKKMVYKEEKSFFIFSDDLLKKFLNPNIADIEGKFLIRY